MPVPSDVGTTLALSPPVPTLRGVCRAPRKQGGKPPGAASGVELRRRIMTGPPSTKAWCSSWSKSRSASLSKSGARIRSGTARRLATSRSVTLWMSENICANVLAKPLCSTSRSVDVMEWPLRANRVPTLLPLLLPRLEPPLPPLPPPPPPPPPPPLLPLPLLPPLLLAPLLAASWAACSSLGIDDSARSITLNALWSCGREMVPACINADNDPCLTTEDGRGRQRTTDHRSQRRG